MNHGRQARVAIVGGGFAALVTFTVLRWRGLTTNDIAVVSPDASPEQSWARLARAINQQWLRSESTGHFFPTDAPGLATVEAVRTRSPAPLIRAWFDRYHPSVEQFLAHAQRLARQTGWKRSLVPATAARLDRERTSFTVVDAKGEPLVRARHVLLAVGHGPARVPEPVAQFRSAYPHDARVSLPYGQKSYGPDTTLVIGDGITAATEWVNVLAAGGAVAALSQNGFVFGQPLQVPRRYFSRRGLRPFCRQSIADRRQELAAATRGTIPRYRAWQRLFRTARKSGRLGLARGDLKKIEPTADGRLSCTMTLADQPGAPRVTVDRVIAATGFAAPASDGLLKSIRQRYQVPTVGELLLTDDDGCLPTMSTADSLCAVLGPAAAWSVPGADSLGGMKIIARRLANRIVGAERWQPRKLTHQTRRWVRLVTGRSLP